jgi:transposase
MLYSGIDLHKDNCVITTINNEGLMINQERVKNSYPDILRYFNSQNGHHKAVVESTSNWYWLSDLFHKHQIDLILAHAKYLKAISYAKVKTDKVDSHTLAQLLRMNLIPAAHQISPEKRSLRDLLRTRLRLVQKRTSCYTSIHRLLGKFNYSVPDGFQMHNPSDFKQIQSIKLDPDYQFALDAYIAQVKLLTEQINSLEKRLYGILITNEDIQRLLTIPGIGKLTAVTIYLEIDGIERFPDVKKFFSYCRLVPGAENSNRKHRHKSSKDGNRYLKMVFMDAAVRAVQYYKEIKQFHQRKLRKSHKAIARNIVAKELARIVYHVLKEGTEFKTFKGVSVSRKKVNQWPYLASPGA